MKLIHCADLHLDSRMTSNLSGEQAKERKTEILGTFQRMIDYARKNGVRAILIAGGSDTGITPGAGVGNKRHALNQETLGVPVIAIGVPTVIDAATITADILGTVTESIKKLKGENDSLYKLLSSFDEDDQAALIRDALTTESDNFMVTPKEIDMVIVKVAKLVADGINLSLRDDFDFEDIEAYVS